jgi:Ca2+/H+ antiporter, TMEM165/GDT1 family
VIDIPAFEPGHRTCVQVGETFVLAMLFCYGRDEGDPFGPARKVTVHIAIIAAVFPIIFVGELPDKTMFASLVMSTRGKPLSVWIGAAGAFLVHVVIAVTIGVALFHLIPHRALEGVVSFMFAVGGVLAIREARKEAQEEEIIEKETASGRRVVTTAFLVIFLAEWGDLTQILTANLAAHYHSPLSVAVGAVAALWAVAALAVLGGQSLLRVINIRTVRIVTAVVLFVLSAYTAWQAIK